MVPESLILNMVPQNCLKILTSIHQMVSKISKYHDLVSFCPMTGRLQLVFLGRSHGHCGNACFCHSCSTMARSSLPHSVGCRSLRVTDCHRSCRWIVLWYAFTIARIPKSDIELSNQNFRNFPIFPCAWFAWSDMISNNYSLVQSFCVSGCFFWSCAAVIGSKLQLDTATWHSIAPAWEQSLQLPDTLRKAAMKATEQTSLGSCGSSRWEELQRRMGVWSWMGISWVCQGYVLKPEMHRSWRWQ